jgi:hypothetical protein
VGVHLPVQGRPQFHDFLGFQEKNPSGHFMALRGALPFCMDKCPVFHQKENGTQHFANFLPSWELAIQLKKFM